MPKSCGRSVCEGVVASSWLVLHWRDPLSIPKHLCDRATRRPEESLEDLLIKSRDQAEAWHFHRDGLFPYLFKRMAGQYFARYDQEMPRTSKVLRTSPWKLDRKVWKPHFGYAGGVGLCRWWRLWWGARDGDIERDREAIKSTHRPPTPCLILYCTDMYWYYPILPSWTRPKPDEASRFGGLVCLAAWLPGRFRWLLRLSTVPSRTQWKQGLDVSVHHWRPWDVNVGNHWLVCRPLESGSRDDVPKVPLGNGVQHAVLGIPRAPGDWRHLGRLRVSLSLISLY